MAVVIGVVFGVAASIPTSLLIVAATRGQRDSSRHPAHSQSWGPDPKPPAIAPQIIVVAPPVQPSGHTTSPWLASGGALPQLAPPQESFLVADTSRRFKVVGEDEYWLENRA
jgi:hypothetical protein